MTAEVAVTRDSPLAGQSLAAIEQAHGVRVLARTRPGEPAESPPPPGAVAGPGDVLVVHTPAVRMAGLAATARR